MTIPKGVNSPHQRKSLIPLDLVGVLVYGLFWVATVVCFYSSDFFYYWDEWDAIYKMASMPIYKLLFAPHNEHLFPVHRLYFFLTTSLFGEKYNLHILLNCAFHALNAWLLWRLLRAIGLHNLVAFTTASVYLLVYAHWDNIGIAFQSQVLLSVLFALAALRLHFCTAPARKQQVVLAGVLALLSAWTFGSGLTIALLLAIFTAIDWVFLSAEERRAPRFWPVGYYLGVFGLQAVVYAAVVGFAHASSAGNALTEIITAPSFADAVARSIYLGFHTLTMAFYGPLMHVIGLRPEGGHIRTHFLVALLFLVCCLAITWRTRWRVFCIKMLCFQLMVFSLIAVARLQFGTDAGFADRYQSYGLIGVVACLGVIGQCVMTHAVQKRRRLAIVIGGAAIIVIGRNVYLSLQYKPLHAVNRGIAIRYDYYRLKELLTTSDGMFPDIRLTRHGHAGFPVSRLVRVIDYLNNPGSAPTSVSRFMPVRYYEQNTNTRPWGYLLGQQYAVQTIHFPVPGTIEQIELWFATGGKPKIADCALAIIDDGGRVLYERVIPGRQILDNIWIGCRIPSVPVADNREYAIRARSFATDVAHSCTLWMNADESSWPEGGTVCPDGDRGDLCFRVVVSALR